MYSGFLLLCISKEMSQFVHQKFWEFAVTPTRNEPVQDSICNLAQGEMYG